MTKFNKSLRLFAAASVVAIIPASAFAADAIDEVPQPPIAPANVEVFTWQGGYIGASAGAGVLNPTPGFETETGFTGGVFAGYNIQNGNVVFAPEIDIDGSIGSSDGLDPNYVARLKGKLGYAFDRTLVSAVAGGAYAGVDVGGNELNDFGYVVGASVDHAITDNVFAGAEYLYHRFDDFDNSNVDADLHTIKARVGFKF